VRAALGGDPDRDYSELLTRALELGVNFFDSADFYGGYRSEEWLGKVVTRRREEVVIATKFGTIPGKGKDWSVPHMRRSLEESLRRLRTEYIDIYQLHSPAPSVLDDEELLAALQEVKREGKIRFCGISTEGGRRALDAVDRWGCDSIQITFNAFHQDPAAEFFPEANRRGVGVIAKSPLDSGMLGGDLTRRTGR
jgi:aryl-alcohol dehydrogenase-like predicted oxidoreductase